MRALSTQALVANTNSHLPYLTQQIPVIEKGTRIPNSDFANVDWWLYPPFPSFRATNPTNLTPCSSHPHHHHNFVINITRNSRAATCRKPRVSLCLCCVRTCAKCNYCNKIHKEMLVGVCGSGKWWNRCGMVGSLAWVVSGRFGLGKGWGNLEGCLGSCDCLAVLGRCLGLVSRLWRWRYLT